LFAQNSRDSYCWKDNGPVYRKLDWNNITVRVPKLCPVTEQKRIINQIVAQVVLRNKATTLEQGKEMSLDF
jgi:hypothetical protein